jgi:hypothetical protein
MEQEQFVGFDVSQAETSVCVVDGAGKVLWQGKCASTPEAMTAAVQRRAPHATRIALETGPMTARATSLPCGASDRGSSIGTIATQSSSGRFGIRVKSSHRTVGCAARARLVISPTMPRLARPAIRFCMARMLRSVDVASASISLTMR